MSATTTLKAATPATVPASSVVPFPMPWGGGMPCPPPLPGCCPPGGMDKLMQCYCDIQAAQAFISALMIDAINNNPAVTQAIIAAIEKSGSSLPLIGVTNGAAAQPGQVGEYVQFTSAPVSIPTGPNSQAVTMGILQPGDWDVWIYTEQLADVHDISISINPLPIGFTDVFAFAGSAGEIITLTSPTGQALISVPSLVVVTVTTNQAGTGPSAASTNVVFAARRAR